MTDALRTQTAPSGEKYLSAPAGSRVLRLSRIRRHVEKRINLIAARMSGNPGEAKTMVFKLCNGTADTSVYAVVPTYHVTPDNEVIISTPYGEILEIKGKG